MIEHRENILGFINFWKDKDIVSRQALNKVIAYLQHLNLIEKKTKVGYSGTLDPFAEGILPIGIGKATKLFPCLLNQPKEYLASIKMGIATDTYDATGEMLSFADASFITRSHLENILPKFSGQIIQEVPPFSAVKVNGQRLYKIARNDKNNLPSLPKRKINIFSIQLFSFVPGTNPYIYLKIKCSSGTYIRSLAVDLGKEFNLPAHLYSLARISYGNFKQANSVKLEQLLKMSLKEIKEKILPCDYPLRELPQINLNLSSADNFSKGNKLFLKETNINSDKNIYKVYAQNKFIGIGKLINTNKNFLLKPETIISSPSH